MSPFRLEIEGQKPQDLGQYFEPLSVKRGPTTTEIRIIPVHEASDWVICDHKTPGHPNIRQQTVEHILNDGQVGIEGTLGDGTLFKIVYNK